MQIDVFLLADHAQLSEGKLYLSGGGWTRLTVERVPVRRRVGLAIGLRIDPDEAGVPHPFRLDMQTPGDLIELGQGQFETEPFEGPSQVFLLAINADLLITCKGTYEVILSTDGNEMQRIGFQVAIST
jgi:hypothetical protein